MTHAVDTLINVNIQIMVGKGLITELPRENMFGYSDTLKTQNQSRYFVIPTGAHFDLGFWPKIVSSNKI